MSKTHRTTYVQYTEHTGSIWEATYETEDGTPLPVITDDIARQIVSERLAHQEERPVHMLLHADPKIHMTWEAKIYLSSMKAMAGIATVAIVYDEQHWDVVANFMPWVRRFPITSDIFTDSQVAKGWLGQQPLIEPDLPIYLEEEGGFEDTWIYVLKGPDRMTNGRDKALLEVALKNIDLPRLTKAELQVLSDLDNGLTAQQIAQKRKKKVKTVSAQQLAIYRKLNTHHAVQTLAKARLMGITPILEPSLDQRRIEGS